MGYQFKSVLSGSMEPTFLTGSIIAIEPTKDGSKYQKGDVITFKEKDENYHSPYYRCKRYKWKSNV